jgi:hypothetical protein
MHTQEMRWEGLEWIDLAEVKRYGELLLTQ